MEHYLSSIKLDAEIFKGNNYKIKLEHSLYATLSVMIRRSISRYTHHRKQDPSESSKVNVRLSPFWPGVLLSFGGSHRVELVPHLPPVIFALRTFE